MNPVFRGVRNAFRNGVRTLSITTILGLSIGLSLTMLIANKAVENKIKSVKSSIGNTIAITPAGFTPGSQTNNALTTTQLASVKSLTHVTGIDETLTDRQSTTGTSSFGGRFGDSSDTSNQTTTSLSSPVTLNANGGGRFFAGGASSDSSDSSITTTFSLPVSFLGTTNTSKLDNTSITLESGQTINGNADTNDALISSTMATKNSLSVGSTFTAYNATLTVAGIFNTGSTQNRGSENTVIVSLPALQRLSGQSAVVTSAVATVDSLDNLASVTKTVSSKLGSSADVTSAQEEADNTVKPLNSVKTVSTFSLIGATVAGAVIILLTMIMIVRERKREIGVVKAIGGSNIRIMSEFMVESVTLALAGAVIGLLIGFIGGQPVTKMLVNNSTTSSSSSTAQEGPGGPSTRNGSGNQIVTRSNFGGGFRQFRNNQAIRGISDVKAQIGLDVLGYGLVAAILIAMVGSGLAAIMISKVRPSTIMRSE
ncbi:MAG TPA: FtsX-like permease family protein [Candidatus Microsaccharimonas sp.]|nr:FtsX-like permease family protein [Candidatus Microsaccharimonas sp.]